MESFVDADPALGPLLDRLLGADDRARLTPPLEELGRLAAGELDALAATADANPPQLRRYSPEGERIDEVEFHPAYHRLAEVAFARFGLAAMSHRPGVLGWPTPVPHVVKYALSYVYVQAEFGVACPLSMTDSAARVLRRYDPDGFADEIAALTATEMDGLATGAMFMTERQGGTDVGRTATEAVDRGGHWELTGRKWFASNVSADLVLTLARVPGQGEGTRGLGMFLVPRIRPDGTRNTYRIDRLKTKLGTRSMATGEVTLDGAYARPVGDLTRGFRQMAEMVNVSRLSNAMRAAALMRRAVNEATEHARRRQVFDVVLFDQPLMRATLLPLVVDTEAALGLVLECAARLDDADAGDDAAARLIRVLTPLAKYTLCKHARHVTGEAMEVRGGNGYIEDFVDPRLVRDSYLGSIWEGSSNVIALDVLRCLRRDAAHDHLVEVYRARLASLDRAVVGEVVDVLEDRWQRHHDRARAHLAGPVEEQQVGVAAWARAVSGTLMATLLVEQAAAEAADTGKHRTLLVATSYLASLRGAPVPPTSALRHLGEIVDGADVPVGAAREAFDEAVRDTWSEDEHV